MQTDITLDDLLARWATDEGKPYKGSLIDYSAYQDNPDNIGCMCAQGQALHLLAGWEIDRLRNVEQREADLATAKLLNISTAHAVLLRQVNDSTDGAPAIVITEPEKVLGDQAQRVLAFWRHLDTLDKAGWQKVAAARAAAWAAAWDAAGDAARAAAGDAARAAAGAAAGDAAWDAAGDAARAAAWAAARASNEIQGAAIMHERGQPFFFLPLFGFDSPEAIEVAA